MRILQKKVNFINSGHVGHGPLGRDCRKKNFPPLMMWEKTVFESTIGVPFRKKKKKTKWNPCPGQSVWLPGYIRCLGFEKGVANEFEYTFFHRNVKLIHKR